MKNPMPRYIVWSMLLLLFCMASLILLMLVREKQLPEQDAKEVYRSDYDTSWNEGTRVDSIIVDSVKL